MKPQIKSLLALRVQLETDLRAVDRILNLLGVNPRDQEEEESSEPPAPVILRNQPIEHKGQLLGPNQAMLLDCVTDNPGVDVPKMRDMLAGKATKSFFITTVYTSLKGLVERGLIRMGDNRTYYPVLAGEPAPKARKKPSR